MQHKKERKKNDCFFQIQRRVLEKNYIGKKQDNIEMKMRQVNKIEKKKMEWYKLNLKILRFKLNVNIILKNMEISRRLSNIKYRQIRIYSKPGHFSKIISFIIEFYRISIIVSSETLILAFITKFPHQSLIHFQFISTSRLDLDRFCHL